MRVSQRYSRPQSPASAVTAVDEPLTPARVVVEQ
jgi:hypothetical protein